MQGPKGMLAEALANAMSEYFVVDPSMIETRLTRDAGIDLWQIQLKPQQVDLVVRATRDGTTTTCARITGSVERVGFHWAWGKDASSTKGSDWIKDANLVLEGLCFQAQLVDKPTNPDSSPRTATAPVDDNTATQQQPQEEELSATKGGITGYIKKQVMRVISALTLQVTDFEFSVILPDQLRSLKMGGGELHLVVLENQAGDDDGWLRQELSLGQLYASILIQSLSCASSSSSSLSPTKEYPLLSPIQYSAACTRLYGTRFQGGLTHGLQVIGTSIDDGIVLHAGIEQLTFLNDLGGLLVSATSSYDDNDPTPLSSSVAAAVADGGVQDEESFYETPEETASSVDDEDKSDNDSDNENKTPSTFYLPLAGVSIVFPNDTKVSLSGLSVNYCADGSKLQLQGNKGFLIDGFPFMALGDEADDDDFTFWCVDLVQHKFSVEQKSDKAVTDAMHSGGLDDQQVTLLTRFQARNVEVQKVLAGVNQILQLYNDSQDKGALAILQKLRATAGEEADNGSIRTTPTSEVVAETSPTTWTAEIAGAVVMSWQGSDINDKMEFSVKGLSATSTAPSILFTIGQIDHFLAAGIFQMTEPLRDTIISFDGTTLELVVADVKGQLLDAPERKEEDEVSSDGSGHKSTELPFGVRFRLKSLLVEKPDSQKSPGEIDRFVLLQNLELSVLKEGALSGRSVVMMQIDHVDHDLFQLTKPTFGGVIDARVPDRIDMLAFHADSITVATGYSLMDWTTIFPLESSPPEAKPANQKGKHTTMLHLPFACVDELKVRIAVNGVVGVDDTVLYLDKFRGNEKTTLDDLARYYTQMVVSNVPGIISNTNLLGMSVTETALSRFGAVYGSSALSGLGGAAGPAAGVLSIVALDGIRNTIQAGKKSRGVADDDRWKVTDLLDGLLYSMDQATKQGAISRGKMDGGSNDSMDAVLDFTLGAAGGAVEYADENKARLGATGASVIAFGIGSVFAGPVGGFGAAILVGAATGTVIDKIDPKNNKNRRQQRQVDPLLQPPPVNGLIVPQLGGVLVRRRQFFTCFWRVHYFCITSDQLLYYQLTDKCLIDGIDNDTQNVFIDDQHGPRRSLKLKIGMKARVVESLSQPHQGQFVFGIYENGRQNANTCSKRSSSSPIWVLGAATELSRSQWVGQINQNLHHMLENSGTSSNRE